MIDKDNSYIFVSEQERQKGKQLTYRATYDKLKKIQDEIGIHFNFETVAKESGVTRSTLYNNVQLKERIFSLRAISKASPLDNVIAVLRDKVQLKEEKIVPLRQWVKQLEKDKKKLIVQLVAYEELKEENEQSRKQLLKQQLK